MFIALFYVAEWNKCLLLKNAWGLNGVERLPWFEKYGNLCAWQLLSKSKKEREELHKAVCFCERLPLSGPIPPGHLLPHSGSRSGCCMFVWDMDLDEPSGRPLNTFLCSPPDSLGRWTNWFGRRLFRGPHFITFDWLLSTSHSYFQSVHLPSSDSRPDPAAPLQDTSEGGLWAMY